MNGRNRPKPDFQLGTNHLAVYRWLGGDSISRTCSSFPSFADGAGTILFCTGGSNRRRTADEPDSELVPDRYPAPDLPLFLCFGLLNVNAFGQPDQEQTQPGRSAGYLFVAPGAFSGHGVSGALHFGGGGQALIKGGLGFTGDLGYLAPASRLSHGIGMFSPGAIYQFTPERKTVPFVTGGYTLAFRSGVHSLIHFGGGVDHWFGDRWGLRVEVRDHMDPREPSYHMAQVRVGFLLR